MIKNSKTQPQGTLARSGSSQDISNVFSFYKESWNLDAAANKGYNGKSGVNVCFWTYLLVISVNVDSNGIQMTFDAWNNYRLQGDS